MANGDYSHASGRYATASGMGSFAANGATCANGNFSTAFGLSATIDGDNGFIWNGVKKSYVRDGTGTFNINPVNGIKGCYIGEDDFV